jgi:hypothetical protein
MSPTLPGRRSAGEHRSRPTCPNRPRRSRCAVSPATVSIPSNRETVREAAPPNREPETREGPLVVASGRLINKEGQGQREYAHSGRAVAEKGQSGLALETREVLLPAPGYGPSLADQRFCRRDLIIRTYVLWQFVAAVCRLWRSRRGMPEVQQEDSRAIMPPSHGQRHVQLPPPLERSDVEWLSPLLRVAMRRGTPVVDGVV